VWAPTQDPAGAQQVAARASGVHAADTLVHTTFCGGGFGRRVMHDEVAEAVALAKLQGEPVQVVWSREDDVRHSPYRPVSRQRLRAVLESDGSIKAFHHRIACPSIGGQESRAGFDITTAFGAMGLPYLMEHRRVDWSSISTPVPLGIWRSVANSYTTFAVESFIDELAAAAGVDPLAYRLQLLPKDSQSARLLALAAERSGWEQPLPAGHHRGVSLSTDIVQVAEVSLGEGGVPRVHRVVCAVDCGFAVHPDGVVAQVEGGIVFGLSAALYGKITVQGGRVEQSNFHDVRLLAIDEMPAIEVHLHASADPPRGVGELSTPGIAPAVCNALAAAGRRVRALPLA
jgi:isoquinoline 1-oxidoreductase beta subunit